MVYQAQVQKVLPMIYLLIILLIMYFNQKLPAIVAIPLYLLIPFALAMFLTMFLKFKFKINGEVLKYEMFLLNFRIFKKEVTSQQVISIHFKSVGLMKRCASIKTKKGLNLRIVNFEPKEVYDEIENYANKHSHIKITKTKDYLLLD